ncbi:hypothetical protein KNU79_gp60 [Gordonia phage NadineRae]|uniref:Uncharacterized protein n=1 Tax=Gordonia phage NadineRae TaxID=2652882 RepID=A0A5P8DH94_9CAUD|nr:hypothetical protein KNU79_gp60 [Gordonia phage NadineRae]QFP97779.1 hypothetical protein SEA_NADINERAE_60 [Gordonia phage NadineRae]
MIINRVPTLKPRPRRWHRGRCPHTKVSHRGVQVVCSLYAGHEDDGLFHWSTNVDMANLVWSDRWTDRDRDAAYADHLKSAEEFKRKWEKGFRR